MKPVCFISFVSQIAFCELLISHECWAMLKLYHQNCSNSILLDVRRILYGYGLLFSLPELISSSISVAAV